MDSSPPPPDLLVIDLDSEAASPARARQAVREALGQWQLLGLVDIVQLVVSELVTNAVRHGHPPVHLELEHTPAELRLQVHDGAAWAPGVPHGASATDAESGRGLQIVAALVGDVEVEIVPDDGKVVHARISTGRA